MPLPKFSMGRIVGTPGAIEAIQRAGQKAEFFINEHAQLEQGVLNDEDHALNQQAVKEGGRVFSAYNTKLGEKIWVITKHDGSVTTLLLPEDY